MISINTELYIITVISALRGYQITVKVTMTEESIQKPQKPQIAKPPSIGRLGLVDVDAALIDCEKTIKICSDAVKVKLNNNANISPIVLHDLSRANSKKARLMMRRISLLIDIGDAAVTDLLEKLMKVKPAKVV
jgi:hypothetical protein